MESKGKIYIALMGVVAVCFGLTAQAADWTTYGGNSNRNWRSSESLTFPLSKAWVYRAPQAPSPAFRRDRSGGDSQYETVTYDFAPHAIAVSNRIYFSSSTEEAVFCLDESTGDQVWAFYTEGAVRVAPEYNSGKIYFGSDDGYAYCLNASDGSLVWKFLAADEDRRIILNHHLASRWPIRTGVTVKDGTAYFVGGLLPPQGMNMFAVNASTGAEVWNKTSSYAAQGPGLLSDGALFFGTGRTAPAQYSSVGVQIANPPTGKNRQGGGAQMNKVYDMLAYGQNERGITRIRVATNAVIATFNDKTRKIAGSITGIKCTRFLADDTHVYFLHKDEGSSQSPYRSDDLVAVPKAVATNALYQSVLNYDARKNKPFYWMGNDMQMYSEPYLLADLYTGKSWSTGASGYSMLLASGAVFVGGSNVVTAYNTSNGSVLWSSSVTGSVYELSLANGALYAGTDAGWIYCFENGSFSTPDESPVTFTSPYPSNDSLQPIYDEAVSLAVANADRTKGICLILGGEGRLAYELAQDTDFFIIVLENDPVKAASARASLTAAGLYGSRVVVHESIDELFPHPDYLANLILSEELLIDGSMPYSSLEIFRMLQPYGGTVLFGSQQSALDLTSWTASDMSSWSELSSSEGVIWKVAHRGDLAGAGNWDHMYANTGNTLSTGDQLINTNLHMQWLGDPGPEFIIDRHNLASPPLVRDGKMYILGLNHVTAIDAYNNTVFWERDIPESARIITSHDSAPICIGPDYVYVASSNRCWVVDPLSGNDVMRLQGPLAGYDWGHVAVYSNMLFGSNQKAGSSVRDDSFGYSALLYDHDDLSSPIVSACLFAKNVQTGAHIWTYTNGVILPSTITFAGTNVFFAESRNSTAINDADGRVNLTDFLNSQAYWVALDINTGNVVWEQPLGRVDPAGRLEQILFLSYADGVLLSVSTYYDASNYGHYLFRAMDPADGSELWTQDVVYSTAVPAPNTTDHNWMLQHPTLVNGKSYMRLYVRSQINIFDLQTGADSSFSQSYFPIKGCAPFTASDSSVYYRGYSCEGMELGSNNRFDLTGVTRPSCWMGIIPACGLVLIPEGSSGCVCGMAYQASLALAPEIRDTDAPDLFNTVALDDNTVVVVFNEAVSVASATNLANYSLNNGITISSAVRQTNHLERVTLTVSTMAAGTNTLTVSGVSDLHGNVMSPSQQMNFESGAADSDSDGLPDSWESQYFASSTAAVASEDPDNDGLSNWQEYIAGTDPTSSFSTLLVESLQVAPSGTGYVVKWNSVSGRTYGVYYAPDLNTDFTLLQDNIPATQNVYTDTLHNASSGGFYRIKATK